jgi:hypothetical protein
VRQQVGGGLALNEIIDLEQLYVVLGVGLFTGAGENDPFFVIANALKKFSHFREWLNLREIFLFKKLGAIFVELFPEALDLLCAEEFRQILIGTFALCGRVFVRAKIVCRNGERRGPGFDMELVGINEGAVHIKNESAQGCAV